MDFRIAVDIGGTFTDGVIESVPGGQIFLAKRLTTHDDPGEALSKVVDDLLKAVDHGEVAAAAPKVVGVVHGSTLVTNSLIERKGALTALVATAGTADILDIRREVRYDLYDLNLEMPALSSPASCGSRSASGSPRTVPSSRAPPLKRWRN